MMHPVTEHSSFVDPLWFNKVKYGQHEGVALDARTIEVEGKRLTIDKEDLAQLIPGEKVFLVLRGLGRGGNFFMVTEAERNAALAEQEAQRQAEQATQRAKEQRRRDAATAFYARYKLPVLFTTGFKAVLSGLSERSAGNGTNAATVAHLQVLEDLDEGRLHRQKGTFLCTVSWNGMGKQWLDGNDYLAHDSLGEPYMPPVTCQGCLKVMERWKVIVDDVSAEKKQ